MPDYIFNFTIMIKSMTGFGKAELSSGTKVIRVEMRSLNSKFFDLNLRMPSQFREHEMTLRNKLNEQLERGKIDCSVFYEDLNSSSFTINHQLAKNYFEEAGKLASAIGQSSENLLPTILKMPDVLKPIRESSDEHEWAETFSIIEKAIAEMQKFRKQEGEALKKILSNNITNILQLLTQVEALESERIENIRNRISKSLDDAIGKEKIDQNRFEQELIYYIEKIDVSEEKARLKHHCEYFISTMDKESNGRKLGFISQEIGREINTLGSKANHAGIQKIVVQMKDELEKLKEQLLNVL